MRHKLALSNMETLYIILNHGEQRIEEQLHLQREQVAGIVTGADICDASPILPSCYKNRALFTLGSRVYSRGYSEDALCSEISMQFFVSADDLMCWEFASYTEAEERRYSLHIGDVYYYFDNEEYIQGVHTYYSWLGLPSPSGEIRTVHTDLLMKIL